MDYDTIAMFISILFFQAGLGFCYLSLVLHFFIHNTIAAVWLLLSVPMCLMSAHLHHLYVVRKLNVWYSYEALVDVAKYIFICSIVAGISAFIQVYDLHVVVSDFENQFGTMGIDAQEIFVRMTIASCTLVNCIMCVSLFITATIYSEDLIPLVVCIKDISRSEDRIPGEKPIEDQAVPDLVIHELPIIPTIKSTNIRRINELEAYIHNLDEFLFDLTPGSEDDIFSLASIPDSLIAIRVDSESYASESESD